MIIANGELGGIQPHTFPYRKSTLERGLGCDHHVFQPVELVTRCTLTMLGALEVVRAAYCAL